MNLPSWQKLKRNSYLRNNPRINTYRYVQEIMKGYWRNPRNLLELVLKRKISPLAFLKLIDQQLRLELKNDKEVFELKRIYENILISGGLMKRLGLDLGTKNIVLSYRNAEGEAKFRCEINGFYTMPNNNNFAKNMLINAGVPYIERNGNFVALGKKAEEIAHAFNKTLRRPMSDGVLSRSEEDGIEIMATIVHSIIGEINEDAVLYYCVPASAINRDINISFHAKVAKIIMNGYESKNGKKLLGFEINEAQALIMASTIVSKTAIAISFGAGMVNVCYALFGIPVYSFSYVGSGDWIDIESAKQFGYDPARPDGSYKQTPTSISRIKEKMSLSKLPTDPIERAIYINYTILVDNVLDGIIKGFKENEDKARVSIPMPIIVAGGTSIPDGFVDMFKSQLATKKLPFEIGDIIRPERPLFAVAEGCLNVAEMHEIK